MSKNRPTLLVQNNQNLPQQLLKLCNKFSHSWQTRRPNAAGNSDASQNTVVEVDLDYSNGRLQQFSAMNTDSEAKAELNDIRVLIHPVVSGWRGERLWKQFVLDLYAHDPDPGVVRQLEVFRGRTLAKVYILFIIC